MTDAAYSESHDTGLRHPPLSWRQAIDEQLRDVAEVLSGSGLRWWIDSGTLLALVRDGLLFSSDKDLDVGCWADQDDDLASALSALAALGYRVGRRRYRGRVCKYWLRPKRFSGGRSIDLKLYTRHGDLAICPVTHSVNYSPRGTAAWLIGEMVRVPLAVIWRRRFSRSWRLKIPGVEFMVTTWTLPTALLDGVQYRTFTNVELPVPSPVEEYLTFRYGEWRTPVSDWVPHRDDGGLVLYAPEIVLADEELGDS